MTEVSADHFWGWQVPSDHPSFAGHFPGQPVLPGVVLLDMAWAGWQQPHADAQLLGLDQAKFLQPVLPADDLVFEYQLRPSTGTLQVMVRRGQGLVAQCVFRVSPGAGS